MKKKILFLCTGNSCRSQMAEGWCNALRSDDFDAYSAGTLKHGLNQYALKVMLEAGVDISHHKSKTVEDLEETEMDYVITVCSNARDACPIFSSGKVIHYGFDDPPFLSKSLSDENEILDVYRRVRDEIKSFIIDLKV